MIFKLFYKQKFLLTEQHIRKCCCHHFLIPFHINKSCIHSLLLQFKIVSEKCFQLYPLAQGHSMSPFLNSHMAMTLPSAYADSLFLANLGSIWVLCVSSVSIMRRSKINISSFPLKQHFYNFSEHEDHFLFPFFQFVRSRLLLLEAETI